MDYKQAGVDIEAGSEVVRRIGALARRTFTPVVLSEIGSFGGLFRLDAAGLADPVLVASADGVGTKLRIAFLTGTHRTIGIDPTRQCENSRLAQACRDSGLRLWSSQIHVLAQILPLDARLQFLKEGSFADNFAAESVSPFSQQSTGVDEYIKTLFTDQPPDGEN